MLVGGTPLHTFELEKDLPNVADLLISYAQNERVILRKRLADCTLGKNTISTRLTQDDTIRFNDTHRVTIQLKIKTDTGEVIVSDPILVNTSRCLDLEVI